MLKNIPSGKLPPYDIYGIIEIPAYSKPIKYEIDSVYNELFVDRFIPSTIFYPCNYGYINKTLSLDNNNLDILIPTPHPLQPKSIIRCTPIGMLNMQDESGEDSKIIAVPHVSLTESFKNIKDIEDLPLLLKQQITCFFETYKLLEHKKWVKILNWKDKNNAQKEIITSCERYKKKLKK